MSGNPVIWYPQDGTEYLEVNDENPLPVQIGGAALARSGAVLTSQKRIAVSSSFTRPLDTTTYAASDLVANSTTAGLVTPLSWQVTTIPGGTSVINRTRLFRSSSSTTNALFRVWMFTAPPTVSNGDNGAMAATPMASCITFISLTVASVGIGADGTIQTSIADHPIVLPAGQVVLYGLVEATAGYVPVSGETFTVTLDVTPD